MEIRHRGTLWVKRIAGRVEVAQIRRFGTSALGRVFRTDVLVLVTRGRRTGRERRTALAFVPTAEGWLVAGGAGGQPRVDWVANLRAEPSASVVVGRRAHRVVAIEPGGDDYEAARRVVVSRWPRVVGYEAASGRRMPVFELRRARP